MKFYRTAYSSVITLYLPLLGLFLLLSVTAYAQLAQIYQVQWVFLLFAVMLLISPARSQSFGERTVNWPKWLLTITGLISLLMLFFYLSTAFLSMQMPVEQGTETIPQTYAFLLSQGGLFPWAIVALLAITLQKVCIEQRQPGLLSSCLHKIFNTDEHHDVGKFMNIYIRHVNLFAIIFPLIILWLAILHCISAALDVHFPVGINVVSMLVTTYLFWLMNMTRWLRSLNWLLDHHVPKLLSIILSMFSLGILLAATSYLLALGIANLQTPLIAYHFFNAQAWPQVWQAFNTFMQFCWVPFASAVIATVSRGYSIWQIILATLAVPFVALLIIPTHQYSMPADYFWLFDCFLIVVCIALLWVSLRTKYLMHLCHATLPFPHELKQRNTVMYCRTIVTTAVTMLCIYWVAGVQGMNIMYAAATIPAMVLIMMSIGANLRSLLIRH